MLEKVRIFATKIYNKHNTEKAIRINPKYNNCPYKKRRHRPKEDRAEIGVMLLQAKVHLKVGRSKDR
jgi:hypothetical protein